MIQLLGLVCLMATGEFAATGQCAATAECMEAPVDGWKPDLITSLKDRLHAGNIPSVRINALERIAHLGRTAEPLAPVLADLLDDPDATIREMAAFSLGRIDAKGAKAGDWAPRLATMLTEDPAKDVRAAAAEALGEIGVQEEIVISSLIQALGNDPNKSVRFYAAHSLGSLKNGSVPVVRALAGAAKDASADVRAAAICSLGLIQRHPSESLPPLVDALHDPHTRHEAYAPDVAGEKPIAADAAEALGMFGSEASAAIPQLEVLMKSNTNLRTRVGATVALIRISGPCEKWLNVLCDVLRMRDNGEWEREHAQLDAAKGLRHLRKPTCETLECLQQALNSESSLVRHAAAETLGHFGDDARPAMAALEQLLDDENEYVRVAAGRAIARIKDGGPQDTD